jgi:ribosome-associated protein
MRIFELREAYIQLNDLLKVLHLVGTGGEANLRIVDGEVMVNGEIATQKRKKLRAGDVVVFKGKAIEIKGGEAESL